MFRRILLMFVLPMLIADLYIFFVFIRKMSRNTLVRVLWFVPSILLLAGFYLYFYSGMSLPYRDTFMITFIGIALAKVIFTVVSWLDLPLRYFFRKWKVYPFTIVGIILSCYILFIAVYGHVWGKTQFEVKEVIFTSANLPASFDNYRIVQISDLHIGSWHGDLKPIQEVVDIVNAQNADIAVFTGDLVNNRAVELNGYDNLLSSIRAKDGVYSILGNHDYGLYYSWRNEQEKAENLQNIKQRQTTFGWRLLNNEHEFITRGNDSIAIVGVENAGENHFPDYSDLPKAMRGIGENTFKLLLSHDPSHWRREVIHKNIDLMLAGHTHGTQLIVGPFSIAQFVYPEWRGLYMHNNNGLYVNVGIGFVGVPFRYGAFPEITVITLKKE